MSWTEDSEPFQTLVDELREYLKICEDVHSVVRKENQCLNSSEPLRIHQFQGTRRDVLERLTDTQMRLSIHKTSWLRVPSSVRSKHPEVAHLIRQTLDLIMRTIVLDRENEQLLLRQGMVPHQRLPPAHRQNPHFVARLYRNNRAS